MQDYVVWFMFIILEVDVFFKVCAAVDHSSIASSAESACYPRAMSFPRQVLG